jgi:hypothetical protein
MAKKYDNEFKVMIIELLNSGINTKQVSDNYDFKCKRYLYFENDKEKIAAVFIPKIITNENINNIILSIVNQIKSLNLKISHNDFKRPLKGINFKYCVKPLKDEEVNAIIDKTYNNKDCKPVLNKQKRFLFNLNKKLTFKEKMKIINPVMGERTSNKTN